MSAYKGGTKFKGAKEGLKIATNVGYDVTALLPKVGNEEYPVLPNGQLHNGYEYIGFYCDETRMDFALEGSRAQSRYVQDFYPHNIRIPSIVVSCETTNQNEYGEIVEFIHESQRKGVEGGQQLQLYIAAGGPKIDVIKPEPNEFEDNKRTKGYHKEILAKGFVQTIDRTHKRFEYKKDFNFEFIVAVMESSAVYSESDAEYPKQQTYAEIVTDLTKKNESAPAKAIYKEVSIAIDAVEQALEL